MSYGEASLLKGNVGGGIKVSNKAVCNARHLPKDHEMLNDKCITNASEDEIRIRAEGSYISCAATRIKLLETKGCRQ